MNILQNASLLVVDDDADILALLNILLSDKCKKLTLIDNPRLALKLAQEEKPDIILLDVVLGKLSGYDLCRQLKADVKTQPIPVIFLSGLVNTADKVKGFDVGAVDYIAKPFVIEEVIARINSCLITHQKIYPKSQVAALALKIGDYDLKARELEILQLYLAGYKRGDIAVRFDISENTVKWYLKQIFHKLQVDSRAALIEKCSGKILNPF